MKTLTEFTSVQLKTGLKTKTELTTAGKTAEELPAALGEAMKLEGDKLKFFVHAMDSLKGRVDGLKRVVVMTFAEGEKVPPGVQKKDEQHYLVEYFPSLEKPKRGRFGGRDDRGGGRDGKGRGKKGRSGRGGERGDRGGERGGRGPGRPDRQPRLPQPNAEGIVVVNLEPGKAPAGADGRPPRQRPPRNRGPRKPFQQKPALTADGKPVIIKPLERPINSPAPKAESKPAEAAPVAAEETPKTQ